MADVILFRPKNSKIVQPLGIRLPLGLLFVASPLVKNGYKIKIIDGETNPHWKKELSKELKVSLPICAGVSSMTGVPILEGLEFSQIIKSKSNVPVAAGNQAPAGRQGMASSCRCGTRCCWLEAL